jgi:hypothetical protein
MSRVGGGFNVKKKNKKKKTKKKKKIEVNLKVLSSKN